MENLIFSLKNIVIIIVISEFLKNFLMGEKYKKYISISINILVMAFIIFQIKGTVLSFDVIDENRIVPEFSSEIQSEYEKEIIAELKKEFEKNNISLNNIIIETDERYNVIALKIFIEKSDDYDIAQKIPEGLGLNNYEIIKPNK